MEQIEVLLESCCQMSNCFPVGDMNTDLLETSAIGNKYLNSLKLNGPYQGIKKPTRVTPTSVSLLERMSNCILQNLNPFVLNTPGQQCLFFEMGIIKRNT